MAIQIAVEARVPGQSSETGVGCVDVTLLSPRLTVADLVRIAVEEQVRTLTARRTLTVAEIHERLARQYPGERRPAIAVPNVDPEEEVERALQACRTSRCIVVVGGRPVQDLDQEIVLAPEMRVQFLRLVPLAGG
jgi:hypothetical protein